MMEKNLHSVTVLLLMEMPCSSNCSGGELDAITSTLREAMADRLSHFTDKTWIPGNLRHILDKAREILA